MAWLSAQCPKMWVHINPIHTATKNSIWKIISINLNRIPPLMGGVREGENGKKQN